MSEDDRNTSERTPASKHGPAALRTKAPPSRGPSRWPWPRLVLLLGALCLAVGLGAGVWRQVTMRGSPASAANGPALVGGPFQMVDQDGRTVDQRILEGRWSAVFFGYTFCPDVCPATLSALNAAKARVGDRAKGLQVVFVSVDPARDTPAQLKSYLSTPAFPHPIIGLTGTPAQVAAAARAYKAYYAKSGTGPAYLMDHTSAIYLMDPKGRFDRLLSSDEGLDGIAKGLGEALAR